MAKSLRNRKLITSAQNSTSNLLDGVFDEMLDAPQKGATYLVSSMLENGGVPIKKSKYQKPSEFFVENDIISKDNKVARAGADIFFDPLNLLSAPMSIGMKGNKFRTVSQKLYNILLGTVSGYDNIGEVSEKYNEKEVTMKKKKYGFGTSIESPVTAIARNQQAIAKADLASTNGFTDALDMLGGFAMSTGANLLKKGLKQNKLDQQIDTVLPGAQVGLDTMLLDASLEKKGMVAAFGGTVPVEVEGGESANLPNGKLVEFKGPKHSKGGIDVDLPPGTDIFSDRIVLDGMTMGERNTYRGKKLRKLSSLAGNSTADLNTFKRTQETFQLDEENDLALQTIVKASSGSREEQKMAFGGKVSEWIKGISDETRSALNGVTAGDLIGMYSTFKKGTAGMQNTEAHRAGQTPNINPFENYGKESLQTMDNAMQFSDDILASNIADIQNNAVNLRARNRATSRGINTSRAFDVASSVATDKAINDAYTNNSKLSMEQLNRKAALQADVDNKVMSGEAMRDENDRNDYDAYYSNRGRDLQGFFEGFTQIGSQFNKLKERDVQGMLLNLLSKNFDVDINTGEIKSK